jgi:hypothetical protein
VAPEEWVGAGSAPYQNVIGADPHLTDPENGDYRPIPGSPAVEYGCQTFNRSGAPPEDEPRAPSVCPDSYRGDVIDVSGSIFEDTVWSAETVRVVGDVTVENGATLTIVPGVRVEFQDFYRLEVAGALIAVGAPGCRILFTTDEPQDFGVDESLTGCWNGIRFDGTLATNTPSRLAYCVIEYSKATGEGGGSYPYAGGAVSVVDFSQLTIENCVIRNNLAEYGGALFFYRQADPTVVGNLIVDNHALLNASAIYCAYSCPRITGNTIVGNTIHNELYPYVESCAGLNFIAKPFFTGNIIRDNNPIVMYMHSQLWQNKDYCTHYNNIEQYEYVGGNIDADPLFTDPANGDYRLAPDSPCIDAADNRAVPLDVVGDLDGRLRFADRLATPDTGYGTPPIVDMGAYEQQCVGDLDGDGEVDLGDLAELLGSYGWTAGAGYADGDLDFDGDVDLSDLAELLGAYRGGCP